MKKFLVFKVIAILLILIVFVGCSNNKEVENIIYEKDTIYGESTFEAEYQVLEAEKEVGIPAVDSENTKGFFNNVVQKVTDIFASDKKENTIFENVNEKLKEDEISEIEYSKSILDAAFYPSEIKKDYGNIIYNDTKIDVSNDLQRLVDEYDDLKSSDTEKLKEILFIERREVNTSFRDLFIRKVSANETEESVSLIIEEGIYAVLDNLDFYEEYFHLIALFVDEAGIKYREIGFTKPEFRIEFNFVTLPICVDSYSSYVPFNFIIENEELIMEPTFKIFIDMNLEFEEIQAAVYHELFHAYQYEAGLIQTSEEAKWLKESTAMWAVDQVDRDFNFEHKYIHYLYSNHLIDPYAITDEIHSWYQMFQFFTEDTRAFDTTYISKLIKSYGVTQSLDDSFTEAHAGRQFVNEDFARFGMALFNNEHGETGIKSYDSNYPLMGIVLEEENFFDFDILVDSFGAEWQMEVMDGPGIKPLIIKIPDDFQSQVNVMIKVPFNEDKKSGIVVGKYANEEWTYDITDILLEKWNYVYDIEDSEIEAICLIMYNTDFNDAALLEFKIGIGVPDYAEGTIKYTIKRDMAKGEAGVVYKDSTVFTLTEELSRYAPEETTAELLEFQRSMMGDTYYIDELTIDYKYTSDYSKGDNKEKERWEGIYAYIGEGTDPSSGGLGGLLGGLIPDTSGGDSEGLGGLLGGLIPETSGEPTPSGGGLEGILSGLGDLAPGGLEGLLTPDELEELEMPEGAEGLGGFLAMDTLGKLKRFTIKSEMNSFEIFPSLPTDLTSEDWIDIDKEVTYRDEDGKLVTDRTTRRGSTSDLFPIWFINPNYNPDEAQQIASENQVENSEDFINNFDDNKEIMDNILELNSKLNKNDIASLIEDPNTSIGIDLTKHITSLKEGTQYEKVMFNGTAFKGEITATFTTKSDNYVTVKIEYNYKFK